MSSSKSSRLGNSLPHLFAEVNEIHASEVVEHGKPAAIEIIPQVFLLTAGQVHKARLGEVEKRELEDIGAVELDDLVSALRGVYSRKLLDEAEIKILGVGVVMVPRRLPVEQRLEGHVELHPGEDELGRLVLSVG